VAPYPFTTLMPNLGVLASGGPSKTVLADLPGLIEGERGGGRGAGGAAPKTGTRIVVLVWTTCLMWQVACWVACWELRATNATADHVVVVGVVEGTIGGCARRAHCRALPGCQGLCWVWAKGGSEQGGKPVALCTAPCCLQARTPSVGLNKGGNR